VKVSWVIFAAKHKTEKNAVRPVHPPARRVSLSVRLWVVHGERPEGAVGNLCSSFFIVFEKCFRNFFCVGIIFPLRGEKKRFLPLYMRHYMERRLEKLQIKKNVETKFNEKKS
jgi:hypothetical protein